MDRTNDYQIIRDTALAIQTALAARAVERRVDDDLTRFYNLDWFALQMYTSFAATLMAIALKRAPRLQTIVAGLLMQVFLQVFVYTTSQSYINNRYH